MDDSFGVGVNTRLITSVVGSAGGGKRAVAARLGLAWLTAGARQGILSH